MPTALPTILLALPSATETTLVARLLRKHGFKILSPVTNAKSALRPIARHQPALALIDDQTNPDTLEVLDTLQARQTFTRILVYANRTDPAIVLRALQLGARGYQLRSAGSTELVAAARIALNGGVFLSHDLLDGVLGLTRQALENRPNPYRYLSHREQEVLLLMVRGLTTAEIATALSPQVSHVTVETHRKNLRAKLGLTGGGSALLRKTP